MRQRATKQTLLTITRIIIIAVCLSAPALAEDPPPAPTPTPRPISKQEFVAPFSEALKDLARRAEALLPVIRGRIEGDLLPWLETLSISLAGLVMIAAFARMWRENAGAGVDLFWWFTRLAVILALMGNGPRIVDEMFAIGQKIPGGEDGKGALSQLYTEQRDSFDKSYTNFVEGVFKVQGESVKPIPGGALGAVLSHESAVPDPIRKLDGVSRNMPFLFDSLNFSRGVISFGDLFLTLLSGFLMIAMRLAAPIMIALAIDRSLAQRVTYPYLWGVIVLTLIWPVVAILIRAIAYMGGNIAMALGDNKQFHKFDERTMEIITTGDPFYTALFASVIMLIAGLSLWASPYIAYQLSLGRIYEGVSTTISSWVGQLMGVGIGYYSAAAAAGINRQAEVLQANAQTQATEIQARAGLDAGERFARASRILGVTQANASARYQNEMAILGSAYQSASANAQLELMTGMYPTDGPSGSGPPPRTSTGLIGMDMYQKRIELGISTTQETENILAHGYGNAVSAGTGVVSGLSQELGAGYGAASALNSIGNYSGFVLQSHMQLDALSKATDQRLQFYGANGPYKEGMETAHLMNNARQRIAARENEIGSINASNNMAREVTGGYNSAYNLSMQGNNINFRGSIDAANVVRNASVDAARLRYNASIISELGRTAAKDIEQALTLRY